MLLKCLVKNITGTRRSLFETVFGQQQQCFTCSEGEKKVEGRFSSMEKRETLTIHFEIIQMNIS